MRRLCIFTGLCLLSLGATPGPKAQRALLAVEQLPTPEIPVKAAVEPSYPDIAANDEPTPRINGPRVVGTTPGHEFIYRIPATGAAPLTYTATNLPEGLSFDAATGIIRGKVAKEGTTPVVVTVRNRYGAARATLRIVTGKNKLALTPPMGWNSWNVWGTSVSDAKVRAAAEALEQTGLAACGYRYVCIDDGWQGRRTPDGTMQPNERFPDMAALGDFLHAKGLLFGIYTSPGPFTCGRYVGSWRHEEADAQLYAKWGVDYLKHDWCSYEGIARQKTPEALQRPYAVMRAALDKTDRDIVYAICQYGMGEVWTWARNPAIRGNLWRTTSDIEDTWASVSAIGFQHSPLARFAGPGGWNDPDMLVVGVVGWGEQTRPTRLTPDEQITHVTLWALLAAPLMLGCDLTQLNEFTRRLLTNPEVIAIDQDELGVAATRRDAAADGTEVWARPLADGRLAVGLFNRSEERQTVTAKWSDLGLRGRCAVRDVWQRRDVGVFDQMFAALVPPHGARLILIRPPRPGRPPQRKAAPKS
ncbi:MAG: putative Ig domain-containing protein [Chloracidobacterium sp.]|nr:putative Ig domain-containing protein [Chloracidobacterium sp.]MDW8218606.1 putative Ig domain-containing protein [Acidobacteriota bacterium]